MLISKIIMTVMALFFVLGAIDRLIGNKLGLGAEFQRGFGLMGQMALTILGLICIAPVVAQLIQPVAVPLYALLGADAAMFSGTFLAGDSGGYAIAAELAADPRLALFGGLIVASVMGAVISFTLPTAYGLIEKEDTKYFATGILSGFIFDPLACFFGGLAMGLPAATAALNLIPVVIVALAIVLGLYFIPTIIIKAFRLFARFLMLLVTIGLICGALTSMLDITIIPGMRPISDGFRTVGTITLVLGGALPFLFVLRRVLKRPLSFLGRKIGINDVAVIAMVFSLSTIVPVYVSFKDMNTRGKVVVAAFTASMSNMFGAHLGFIAATDPSIIAPMFVAKIIAGAFAIPTAIFFASRLFKDQIKKERTAETLTPAV